MLDSLKIFALVKYARKSNKLEEETGAIKVDDETPSGVCWKVK